MTAPTKNNRLGLTLLGVAALMVSLSFAAVPFYSWFCRTTGYGGTPLAANDSTGEILDQLITIAFDANTDSNMPWEFKPVEREMTLRVGETGLAFYEAYNPTDHTIAGSAAYNVAPEIAGGYFNKIECFCFTEQVLRPHERILMPVTFFVDPEITRDIDTNKVAHITLSYTFYQTELPQAQANLSSDAEAAYN
ncbi:MAG: cytochrome c oxidase assembly protein [Paracoccaceae bacterium]